MNPDILKPKEENLFSLATEMGLLISEEMFSEDKLENASEIPSKQKPYSQLT